MEKANIYHMVKKSRRASWKYYLIGIISIALFFYFGFSIWYRLVFLLIPVLVVVLIELCHAISQKLYVADYGVRKEEGIFNKRYMDINYKDILRTTVDQTFMGRILNYGNISIDTAGMEQAEISMHRIPKPLEIKKTIDFLVDQRNKKSSS